MTELRKTAASGGEDSARQGMLERLAVATERYESGVLTSELNVVASWLQGVREVFDLMPVDGEEAQGNLAARMAVVPAAYAGLRQTYLNAAAQGRVAPRRQVLACARQCAEWSQGGSDFYSRLVRRTAATGALRADLDRAAAAASAATAEFGQFLETGLLPAAPDQDAAGRERYELASRAFLGAEIDLDETYAWGWAEVMRVEEQMRRVASQIVTGGSVAEAVTALDTDPARRITGREAMTAWMQEVADAAMAELDGTHFDIPPPARRIEAMIAPTTGGGIYYTGPSEDWTRPGRMWWALGDGVDELFTWRERTTVYHEGVPGHHLQSAQAVYLSDRLNRWQRLMCWISGHGEGWGLYAERLMDELGYLTDPGDKLGMLDAQLPRNRPGFPVRSGTPAWPGSSCGRASRLRSRCSGSSWTGTSAGLVRRRPTRSARGSGCRLAMTRGGGRARSSASRSSTAARWRSARSDSTRSGKPSPGCNQQAPLGAGQSGELPESLRRNPRPLRRDRRGEGQKLLRPALQFQFGRRGAL